MMLLMIQICFQHVMLVLDYVLGAFRKIRDCVMEEEEFEDLED
jgi:hypothetical protein